MGREASQQALEAIPRVRALSWDVVPWGLTCLLLGLGSPGRGRHQAAHLTLGQVGHPLVPTFRVVAGSVCGPRSRSPAPCCVSAGPWVLAKLAQSQTVGLGCVCAVSEAVQARGAGGQPGPRKALGFSLAQPCSGSSGRLLLPVLQPQPLPGWGWGGVRAPRPP